MRSLASIAVFLLFSVIPSTYALPNQRESKVPILNSDRLARGLAPMRPRKLYDATRTHAARAGIPSGTPDGTVVSGAAAVYAPNTSGKRNNFLGYLNAAAILTQTYGWSNKFSYIVPSDSSAFYDVKVPMYYNTDPIIFAPFVGAAQWVLANGQLVPSSYDMSADSDNYIGFFATSQVITSSTGTPAAYASPPSGWIEHNSWKIDPNTGIATLGWKNSDGSIPDIIFCTATDQYGSSTIFGTVDPTRLDATLRGLPNGRAYSTGAQNCGLTIIFDTSVVSA